MKRALLTLLFLLGLGGLTCAQTYTTVTATVVDPNGTAYAYGTYTIALSNTTGQQPQLNGNANFQTVFSGSLTLAGLMSISLPSVSVMTPAGLQWQFQVCANPKQVVNIFPPVNTPCFSYTSTGTQISGTSVNISTSLSAVAALIPLASQVPITGESYQAFRTTWDDAFNGPSLANSGRPQTLHQLVALKWLNRLVSEEASGYLRRDLADHHATPDWHWNVVDIHNKTELGYPVGNPGSNGNRGAFAIVLYNGTKLKIFGVERLATQALIIFENFTNVTTCPQQ